MQDLTPLLLLPMTNSDLIRVSLNNKNLVTKQ